MKTQSALLLAAIFSASLAAPLGTFAAPLGVLVDEGGFVNTNQVLYEEANNIAVQTFGFDTVDTTIFIVNETTATNGFGIADVHSDWFATTPYASGAAQTFNFNIYDPANEGGSLSDTLSITLTGITPVGTDPDNMSMDFHFRSDNLSGSNLLPALLGGIGITENGFFQSVNAFLPSQFTADVNNPFSVAFRSDVVPEPSAMELGLLSLLSLPFVRRLAGKN